MSPWEIMADVMNGHTFLLPVRVVDSRIVIIFMAVVKKGHIFFRTLYCNENPSSLNDCPLSLPYFRAASENQIINPVIMHFKSNQWKY